MNEIELLNFLRSSDNIPLIATIEQEMAMAERKEMLAKHPYSVFQGNDGFWRTTFVDDSGKRITKRKKNKEELEDIIIDYYKDKIGTSFLEVINAWLDYKLEYEEVYKQTYDRYKTDCSRFFENTTFGTCDIRKINELYLETFIRDSIIEKHLSSKAYSNLRLLIRGAFKFAYKKGLTEMNIETFFDTLQLSRKMFNRKPKKTSDESVFTDTEVSSIEKWIFEQEPSLINYGIMLAFYTGIRVGELSALQIEDIDLKEGLMRINKTEVRYKDYDTGRYVFEVRNDPKTEAGNRTIILNDEAIGIIKKIRKLNPFGEFLFMHDGVRIKEKAFTVKLYKICDRLGITRKSMHKARKTYATKLINSNVDESLIIDQMGHTDISCTKNHYYFSNAEKEVAREKICNAISY